MAKLVESVTDLIKELTALQNSAAPGRVKDDDFLLPRMIPTGDGRSIIVSKKVDQIIASVARRMNANERPCQQATPMQNGSPPSATLSARLFFRLTLTPTRAPTRLLF